MSETLSPEVLAKKFIRCTDGRGRPQRGIWKRGNRFYATMMVPGKGQRYLPLLDEHQEPVETVTEAQKAYSRLIVDRDTGRTPGPRIAPHFKNYYLHYLEWCETTEAKNENSIRAERCHLNGWAEYLGDTRINHIKQKHLKDYALKRTTEGLSNRTVNLGVIALGNLLKFARDEGLLKGELVTENWKPLRYVAPRRQLLTWDQIQAICDEALATSDGKPKYDNGQFLSDYLKLLAFSGARRQAALSLRWSQVDWTNRQLTLFTKFDKTVVVDFTDKLETHLKDMHERRDQKSPWVFPSPKKEGTYFANPQKLLDEVTGALKMDFNLHDLRHFFASFCVMSGVDTLTVASWLGHSDGGVLIGKVYGHLNPQHKREAAAKVQFNKPEPVKTELTPVSDLSGFSPEELFAALQKAMTKKPQVAGPPPANGAPTQPPISSQCPDKPSAVESREAAVSPSQSPAAGESEGSIALAE